MGYRGIFGCDYVIDDEGNIYFVEVNARKQGTTMEMCCTLENSLPDGCPNLMEIEFFAITQKRLPPGCMELKGNPFNMYWGTYNHKVEKDVKTCRGLEDPGSERKMYERVVRGHQKKSEHMVVEHVGRDVIVKVGSFLGRVISVGKDRESMLKGEQSKMKKTGSSEVILDEFTRELLDSLFSESGEKRTPEESEKQRIHRMFYTARETSLTKPILDFFAELKKMRDSSGVTPQDLGFTFEDLVQLAEKHRQIDEHHVTVGGRLCRALPIVEEANARVKEESSRDERRGLEFLFGSATFCHKFPG